jgi:hypothetical protein
MDQINFGMSRKEGGNARQCSSYIVIVAIQISDDVAGGSRQSLVDSVPLSTISFAYPIRYPITKASYDLGALIGASAINDDVFQIRVLLPKYGLNRLTEIASLIEGGCDNRDSRKPVHT